MRKLTILLFILVLSSYSANAQYIFESAGEKNSIITPHKIGGFILGYEFSASKAFFNYERSIMQTKAETSKIDTTANSPINAITGVGYKSTNYRLGIPITKDSREIFSNGSFNPGVELIFENTWSNNTLAKNIKYILLRFRYELGQNSFGTIDTNDSIQISDRVSHKFEATLGTTLVVATSDKTDKLIVAASLPIRYQINPVDRLRIKEFITDHITTTNGVVQETEEAYQGTQEDYLSLSPKIDFAYTPFLLKDKKGVEIGPRIGLIGSITGVYNTEESDFLFNFSAGPSIHPRWNTSKVIATVQAEFRDFTDVTNEKSFEDIFAIRFFVGIPLAFK